MRPALALVALGLAADVAAGWLVLSGQPAKGLALHAPAVALWADGLARLDNRPLWRPLLAWALRQHAAGAHETISAGALAALVVGLALVPGFGTLGFSVAVGAARLLPRPAPRRVMDDAPVLGDVEELLRRSAASQPLLDLEIQPLVDALGEPDTELRRGAIQLLARDHSADAVRLTRELLSDADPDIRGDAALALSGYQDAGARRLDAANLRVKHSALDAEAYIALADVSRAAAWSGLHDESTSHGHLEHARAALSIASTLAPARAEVWSALAQTQHELGEIDAARRTLARHARLTGANADTALVGMHIAFGERDWDELLNLVASGRNTRPDDADRRELLRWWAAAQPRA